MPLRIAHLSKRYGDKWALRDVEFEASDSQVFGMFGGTASGKTSLLRCIAGLESLNGGSVMVDGNDVSAVASAERDIHLAEPRKGGGLASIFGAKGPQVSSGESRIAEFESAIENGKRVLLLDEPLAGIDAINRERLLGRIRQIAESGRTVVFASADFEQIASVCDRIAVIDQGYIRQIGFPQEVYENPASAAVATGVGRNNLFQARRVTSTNADLPEFFTIDGGHRLFAQPTEKNKLGPINQNVNLAIRPEQISITFGASFPEDNLLKATVTGIRFRSETTLIELDANGLKLEARVFRVVGLDIGEECMIGMPPHCIHVLKD